MWEAVGVRRLVWSLGVGACFIWGVAGASTSWQLNVISPPALSDDSPAVATSFAACSNPINQKPPLLILTASAMILAVLVVWIGTAIDWAHEVLSEVLETRPQATRD
jgi:hypothetical protein